MTTAVPPPSAYDTYAPKLRVNGYRVVPIEPCGKRPAVWVPSLRIYQLMVGWNNGGEIKTPQPDAGVGVLLGQGVVALDFDHDQVALASLTYFLGAVIKEGARGWTMFFRTDTDVPSQDFRVDNKCVVQVLSDGKQTVIPPSVHPDTRKPYTWASEKTLLDTRADQLPTLPPDYRERIMKAIADAGLKATDPEKSKESSSDGSPNFDKDSPHAQINDLAMRNMSAWVPDLNLYKWRRKVGRFPSYEAVAAWRESSTGRPLDQRKLNLQISGHRGIKDFGNGDTFSPLDLVMRARDCTLSEAFDWLAVRVRPDPGPDVDFERLVDTAEAPSIDPDADADSKAESAEKGDTKKKKDDAGTASGADPLEALTGGFWEHGDPLPEQIPMLIPHFVPLVGVGYVGGEWGTFKTFILNDMAVGVSSAGTFAGEHVTEQGCVIQVELEGSQNEVRLTGAADVRGITEKLPIRVFTKAPPKILGSTKRVTPEWKKYCDGMKVQAERMKAKFNMPVRLITIDPVTTIAGWTDEQSSAEGQAVYEGLLYLSQQLNCVVVAADHYGKAPGQGLRGTSVKETAALFILGTSPRDKDMAARRFLEIRKMKNGRQNIAMDFFMDDHSFTAFRKVEKDGVETLEQMDVKTLAIRWDGELHPVDEKVETNGPTPQQHKMLIALKEVMRTKGTQSPHGMVAASKDWEDRCLADKICPSGSSFRNQKIAMRGKFIGVSESGQSVWFLLG